MIFTLITLVVVGIILFILSFFTNDKFKDLEDQIEDVSISTLQETYRLKNKMKVLEEELLVSDSVSSDLDIPTPSSDEKQPPVYDQIKKLHDVGFSIDQIANSTALKVHDVRAILQQIYPGAMEKSEDDAQ
ncbi:hypothetical protein [Salinibacillus xinjiangensis]|uniref:DUF2802 domain-containing protein n=1 Tax=Salinibacillus xinjiangensis TaxID=1229268 RepID=A0A6G1X6K0_9BACI|nr:hypothetical protein [Salinibacillus xinjiangensis]MRG86594.1 hypothetical protein [Salinibacillus xinjiangensis]